jgi:hypothetical protein
LAVIDCFCRRKLGSDGIEDGRLMAHSS